MLVFSFPLKRMWQIQCNKKNATSGMGGGGLSKQCFSMDYGWFLEKVFTLKDVGLISLKALKTICFPSGQQLASPDALKTRSPECDSKSHVGEA